VSGSRDYRDEMYAQREIDDTTVETVLRGGPVPADLEPLTAALGALRALPEQPVRPSDELAARMAAGDFASAVAPRPSRRSAGRHAARRRLATMPLRAKIAAGGVMVLGGLATATVAGALPGPAQQGVQTVIEMVTPIEFDDPKDFGKEVSDDAKDGGVDGWEISERAKEQGADPDAPGSDGQPDPAVVPPGSDNGSARGQGVTPTVPETRPSNAPGDTPGQPVEPGRPSGAGQPDGAGKPDSAGKPESEDPPNELPVEPLPTD
jgi:hypothetical protein